MKFYTFKGRIYDSIEIYIDNEIICATHHYFDPSCDADIEILHKLLTKKKRRGNLVVRGFLDGKYPKNEYQPHYIGQYFVDYFPNYTDKQALTDFIRQIEYKNF